MSDRVKGLERDLAAAKRDVDNSQQNRQKWDRVERKKDAQTELVREAAEEARDDRDHKRGRLVVVADRIADVEKGGITEDEKEVWHQLTTRQDSLADSVEDFTAFIQRSIIRLDKLDTQDEHAEDLKRRFNKDFNNAVQRRERIRKQLKEARKDAQKSALGTDLFVVAEFDCHDGTPVPKAAIPGLRHLVLNFLVPVRRQYGFVVINSGHRPTAYNASVGGASNSQHIYTIEPASVAADIRAANANPPTVATYLDRLGVDGLGRYSVFTHGDNRGQSGWATSRWNGP